MPRSSDTFAEVNKAASFVRFVAAIEEHCPDVGGPLAICGYLPRPPQKSCPDVFAASSFRYRTGTTINSNFIRRTEVTPRQTAPRRCYALGRDPLADRGFAQTGGPNLQSTDAMEVQDYFTDLSDALVDTLLPPMRQLLPEDRVGDVFRATPKILVASWGIYSSLDRRRATGGHESEGNEGRSRVKEGESARGRDGESAGRGRGQGRPRPPGPLGVGSSRWLTLEAALEYASRRAVGANG
ncbi:hypothetical protein KM043_004040 [Ampulex compressa]|nr:hypothetical protein KM043_004040 [Ampulex compressa]